MLLLLLAACSEQPPPAACERPDDTLPLTAVQALGTHNSTHIEPETPLDDSHRYTQPPLPAQLDVHGVRQFELDLHYREGEGFEVFHLPVIDEVTTCRELTTCLMQLKLWSDAHPCHLPLMVWMEPKDQEMDALIEGLLPLIDRFDELEDEILSIWPRERVFTPDDLRGDAATLPEAIADHGWPALGDLRGKVIFSMLDSGDHRAAYLEGSEVLAGRLLFVDASTPADPFAATFKIDDALEDGEALRARVTEGFLVTSNGDSASDTSGVRFAATVAAGAHYIATDRLQPNEGAPAAIPGGAPAACNPVSAPAGCTPQGVEDLSPD